MKEVLNLLIANIKVIIHKINMVANEYLLIMSGLSPQEAAGLLCTYHGKTAQTQLKVTACIMSKDWI